MPVKTSYLLTAAGGAILLWSGLTNRKWSSVLRSIVTGQDPRTVAATANTIQGTPNSALTGSPGGPVAGSPQSAKALGGSVAANRMIGMALASTYGWAPGTQNWTALDYGWGTLESGWNNTALNGSWPSGAYGIPQAHPGNKMPQAAWPSYAGGQSSASSQISWGLAYIKATYGSPSQVPGWLGQGGYSGY